MFFPSRIFIIIYYNYLLIILFCIFTTLFSSYYPLGKDRHERDNHAWRSKRLSGGGRSKPPLDRWRRDNPRTHKNCSQPTNEAWAECRAMLEHYAMQGGGRGYSTDERSMGRVLSDARTLCHARRRKRTLNRLAIDCIYVLSKEKLSKVDREL